MTNDKQFATVEQAAKHFQVSLSTFRGWVAKGMVPKSAYIRIGKLYRFDLPAVETALKGQSDNTGDDE